jgi:hypothetical protein
VICKIEARDLWWSKENKEKETKTEEESSSSGDQAQVTTSTTTSEPLPPPAALESNTASASSTSSIVSAQKPLVSSDPSRVLFIVRAAIQGHVIELNERLVRRGTAEITDPVVIQTLLDKVQEVCEREREGGDDQLLYLSPNH